MISAHRMLAREKSKTASSVCSMVLVLYLHRNTDWRMHMCVSWPTHGQIKWGPNRCAWSGFDSLVLLSMAAIFISWWEKGMVEDLSARWLERPRKSFLGKREKREWETLSTRINTLETLRKAHRCFRCMVRRQDLLHRLQTFPTAKKILEKSTLLSNVLEIKIV